MSMRQPVQNNEAAFDSSKSKREPASPSGGPPQAASIESPGRSGSQRVMIVAGEASGDLHGGALASELFKINPSLQIVGFGGKAMRHAGVDIQFDVERLGVVGIFEVFLHLKTVVQAYRHALTLIRNVDLLVLIDYPDFNLRLAKTAKRLGVPVIYYISPQIWAWRSSRIKTIAERIDKMLVIFPFEEPIYKKANIPCEFVGHPLLDQAQSDFPASFSKSDYLLSKGLRPAATTIGLLPGSRKGEVLSLLPTMLDAVRQIAKTVPEVQVLIPVAPSLPRGLIAGQVRSFPFPIRLIEGEFYAVLKACDAAAVASGTATLQVALAGTPMVVAYRVSPLTYWIARRLVHLKTFGLVNIVAGELFVPELLQEEATPERLCRELLRLLESDDLRETMRKGLQKVSVSLGTAGASHRAAMAVCRMLEETPVKEANTASI